MRTRASVADDATDLNRRESFRINDRVALAVEPLSEEAYRQRRAAGHGERDVQRILNSIIATGENQRGLLRGIRDTDPAVAEYLQSLEDRLNTLARLLGRAGRRVEDRPTHDVNLSGTGIRFNHDHQLPRGARVALEIQIFPSRTCLELLGTVVRSHERDPARRGPRWQVAVDFSDIHPDDQELLIRHVHALQLDHVRRGSRRG